MRKVFVLILLISAMALQFCSSSKNTRSAAVPPKITYTGNVQQIMSSNCTPCHFPPKGNKKAYDTYAAVSGDVDEIINRISRNPTERGFMPLKHPKLSDSTINVFVQWKKDGLLEK